MSEPYLTTQARGSTGPFDDEVRGEIIGGCHVRYEFWIPLSYPLKGKFDRVSTWVDDGPQEQRDAAAIAWFKERYPAEFAAGVEMRVFDV